MPALSITMLPRTVLVPSVLITMPTIGVSIPPGQSVVSAIPCAHLVSVAPPILVALSPVVAFGHGRHVDE